jgi:hypothetical protein
MTTLSVAVDRASPRRTNDRRLIKARFDLCFSRPPAKVGAGTFVIARSAGE